ncbi:MAG: glycosyltransferase, partial [Bacteroidetes bacterium]|nr:glycosyltransferase [Bacteroidota bacterium]
MKIIVLSPAHPLRGGIAASSERLAQELMQAGHSVCIYSYSLQYPGFLFPGKTQFTNDPPPEGVRIETRINSINPFNWIKTGLALRHEKPDMLIVRFWLPFMGPALGTILRVARRFSAKKIKITALVDNIVPHEKRPGDRWFAAYFVRACDAFVVMSHSVGAEIQQFLKDRKAPVRFAPHPIYNQYGSRMPAKSARAKLNLPLEAPIVLFFGFVRKYKGLDLLLEALALCPGVHACIAGECYEDWSFYQNIIDRNELGARVHLKPDFIPNDAVAAYFSAADLVVQPYRSATQSGISQIAYHFDKPMVVTKVGGLP